MLNALVLAIIWLTSFASNTLVRGTQDDTGRQETPLYEQQELTRRSGEHLPPTKVRYHLSKRADPESDVPVVSLQPGRNPVKTVKQHVKIKPDPNLPVPDPSQINNPVPSRRPGAPLPLRSKLKKGRFNTPDRSVYKGRSIKDDYLRSVPHTGVTRHYTLYVDEANLAPDGVKAPFMQVFNGTFPGPLLQADWGDEIVIKVINNLTNNGTSIHWHGFPQTGRTQYDGVNGVTQCPIPPKATMIYKIRAERYGVSWYHSHTSIQYGNGLYGPFIVHGPSSADWDFDLGALMVGDWYSEDMFVLVDRFFDSGPPPAASTVFNGQGVRNTSGTLTGKYYEITKDIKFRRGARYLLRIINSATDAKYELSLDNHTMTVISLDFIPIVPYETSHVFLSIGQRVEVVITATGDPFTSYWFRADTTALADDRGTTCGDANQSANQSRAIVRYSRAAFKDPVSTPYNYTPHCSDTVMVAGRGEPVLPLKLPAPATTQRINISPIVRNGSNDIVFRIDSSSLYLNWNMPTLKIVADGFGSLPKEYNVYRLDGNKRQSALIVLQDQTGIPHPIHLHGHDMSVAALGPGTWNGTISFANPPRRDTVQMEGNGHLVMHFALDNPGAWLWHCHIAFHVSAGLGAQFLERMKDIDVQGLDDELYKTCSRWQVWTRYNLVLQTDSGV